MKDLVRRALTPFPRAFEVALDLKHRISRQPLSSSVYGDFSSDPFLEIYEANTWNDAASKSGPGSNLRYTAHLRKKLPLLFERLGIKSMLDAPCGDFLWMKEINLPSGFRYFGADIVPQLVAWLQTEYGSDTRRFTTLDVRRDPLPDADLWLCRDCLIHLSNADAMEALRNFAASDIRYLLTTTYNYGFMNTDIETGAFRHLNLRAPPFSLPAPLESIFDFVYPWPPRRLAFYSNQQMKQWARC